MSDQDDHEEPHVVRPRRPGDQVLHMRTRRSRIRMIDRGVSTPLTQGYHMLVEIATQVIHDILTDAVLN